MCWHHRIFIRLFSCCSTYVEFRITGEINPVYSRYRYDIPWEFISIRTTATQRLINRPIDYLKNSELFYEVTSMLAPPSETTIVKRWAVRFPPKLKSGFLKIKKLETEMLGTSIMNARFLYIENYLMPVFQLDNECCETFRNRVCIAIRKPKDTRTF